MLEEQNESAGIEENVREEVAVQKQSILKQKQKVKQEDYCWCSWYTKCDNIGNSEIVLFFRSKHQQALGLQSVKTKSFLSFQILGEDIKQFPESFGVQWSCIWFRIYVILTHLEMFLKFVGSSIFQKCIYLFQSLGERPSHDGWNAAGQVQEACSQTWNSRRLGYVLNTLLAVMDTSWGIDVFWDQWCGWTRSQSFSKRAIWIFILFNCCMYMCNVYNVRRISSMRMLCMYILLI